MKKILAIVLFGLSIVSGFEAQDVTDEAPPAATEETAATEEVAPTDPDMPAADTEESKEEEKEEEPKGYDI